MILKVRDKLFKYTELMPAVIRNCFVTVRKPINAIRKEEDSITTGRAES
jgi:hypothetical protein